MYYRRKFRSKGFKRRRKKYHGNLVELKRREPIMRESDWRSIMKFERKWGVMRQGKGWPKF
jgi:hypothetical protein